LKISPNKKEKLLLMGHNSDERSAKIKLLLYLVCSQMKNNRIQRKLKISCKKNYGDLNLLLLD